MMITGYNKHSDGSALFECSICGWECWYTIPGDTETYNFCPNCGNLMLNNNEIYVYTKKAEEQAKLRNLEPRLEGEIAMCGHKPVDGLIAKAWLNKGYIKRVRKRGD